jgi:Ca2+-binding EF-hand superfamily protein
VIARMSAAAVLGLALFVAVRAADPPAPAAPTASVREAVYFGPSGPVRIRLHVAIDGRAADAVWSEATDALFAFRDQNGDGSLDAAERSAFVDRPRTGRDLEFFEAPSTTAPLRLSFNLKDEKDKVTRAAFVELMRTGGRASVGLRVVAGRADSKDLSAALFKHLDQNGDGRLAPGELKAARERLAVLDVDEDEFFTTAELLGRAVGLNAGRQFVVPGTRPIEPVGETTTDLLFLTADGAQAVKQLLTARGTRGATSLRRTELGADAKTFAALDQDGNGALDTTELSAWLRKPADLELAISFDATGGRIASVPATAHPAEKGGALQIALPGGRFRFEPAADVPAKEWEKVADGLTKRFLELAKESGAVERKQLGNQVGALAFFDAADRNADAKVDAAEVAAALKALAPLARCRVDIAFVDLGNGLFELLDRNGDGRLSPRELVESVTVLKPFAIADGTAGPKDLIRQFQVRTAIDPIPVGVLLNPSRQAPTGGATGPAPPVWFTKMDRNGDGDVSLKEFVGPLELFRKLDRDGDGLISPAEASAAEK